jgi:hypothetical protein
MKAGSTKRVNGLVNTRVMLQQHVRVTMIQSLAPCSCHCASLCVIVLRRGRCGECLEYYNYGFRCLTSSSFPVRYFPYSVSSPDNHVSPTSS